MSGKQIGSVVGAVIGAYFGGAQGAQWGAAIGGMIGGAVAPDHINGPKIGDGQQQSATDGNPIAWIQGTAMVAGTIVQVSPRRQIRHKDDVGKGSGTVAVTYTAEQDFAILVCESSDIRDSKVQQIVMVLQDGRLVYDVRPGSKMLADSYKWKANVDFLYGSEGQLPHPTLEAITGVGNTPAYRGSCLAVFKSFDISAAGDRIPTFQFVVAQSITGGATSMDSTVTPILQIVAGPPDRPQDAIGGGYYDMPLGTTANRQLILDALDNAGGGIRRYYVLPLNYAPDVQNVPILNETAYPFLSAPKEIFETGWYVGNPASWTSDPRWLGLWSAAGLPVPELQDVATAFSRSGYDAVTGIILNLPPGTKGVRIVAFETMLSGTPTSTARVEVAQSSEVLEYIDDGRYASDAGLLYLSPWSSDRSGLPTVGSVSLSGICSRVAKRGGLEDADIDVSGLTGLVAGYPIARQANAADCLNPLLQAYFAYATEYDAQLRFKFYGTDANVVIDRADLIEGNDANEGAIVSNLRNQSTEFPRRVVAAYTDPAQNYNVVNVPAERQATDVIAIGDVAFQIPVVMDANDAAQAANKALKVAYATLEGTLEYSVPFAGSDVYLSLPAGEPIQFQGKRYVLDELILGNGSLKLTTRYDRQSAYTSNVQAILGNTPTPPASPYSGPTTLYPMNLPAQRPQDSIGVYLIAASTEGRVSWRGCNVQVSYDGMATWQTALQINMEGTIGTIALDEPSGGEPLTVDVVKYDLDSATSDQLAAAANAFAVISSTDVTQLGQFETATETATDKRYELTNVSRSLGGTGATPVEVHDRFALMDAAYFLPIDPALAGRTIYFRGVGFGEIAEDAQVFSVVYTALVAATGQQLNSEAGVAMQSEDGFQLFNSET